MAWAFALLADDRHWWLQIPDPTEACATQHTADGSGGHADLVCDMLTREALPTKSYDALLGFGRGWSPELAWPRRSIR